MRSRLFSVLATAVVLLAPSLAAHADSITYLITFNATFSGLSAGHPPASGSFTLTLDPTQSYTDATAGLTVNSLDFGPSNPSSSAPSGFTYAASTHQLLVGGLHNSVITVTAGTLDYFLFIGPLNDPTLAFFTIAQPDAPLLASSGGANVDVNVSVVQPSAIPEPSTFLLLGSGSLSALGLPRFRRKMRA